MTRNSSTYAANPYAALWVKSNYSFLEGASHPEELVSQAADYDLSALAITDRDGVYGVVRAHLEAKKLGVHLMLGAQVTVEDSARRIPALGFPTLDPPPLGSPSSSDHSSVILLAKNRDGWGSLSRLLSKGRMRSPKGESSVGLEEVLAVRDCVALTKTPTLLPPLAEAFGGDAFGMVTRHHHAEEISLEQRLRATATLAGCELVGATEVLYHHPSRRPLQDILTCIRYRCSLTEAGRHLRSNAEHALLSVEAMGKRFSDDPALLERTGDIAERCRFALNELDYRYPTERLPNGVDEATLLRQLTYEGAHYRYGECIPSDALDQIERELSLIGELDYGGYFLTMQEIVSFCREENILCQGRGSAANSIVCYCLGITAVDPVRMELLFERFLSRERAEPPDIDLDIEHERREEVIQHVYERFGRRHAAMVANIIRFRVRSAVREVGKALGIPQTDLDSLARLFSHWSSTMDEESLQQAGFDPDIPAHRHLIALVPEIVDFPRHLSIHPGGFLLGHEPVDTLVPIEPATMEGRTVIQWDKQDIEDLGLFKVDLLGLGALTAIHRSLDLLRFHYKRDLTIATVPAEDPATYAMVGTGDTVGVFQIESRAQMAMLPRLKPKTFYDLVIEVAIVRPGPIQGDMVHPYLRRRDLKEPVAFPHPCLKPVLQKTLGVPIFQEQVMKLAMLAANYSPGEADQLRRDMAAWRSKGRIEEHREKLIGRMIERGVPQDFAERVFSQIQGFGEYGFPESHAASFALLAYVTAWLKCHYPAAFACGMLNSQPMGFYSPSTLVEDAKRHGVEVHPIDVQASRWDCTLTSDGGLRMGFRYVDGFGVRERERLEASFGPYPSLSHFVRRARLGRPALVRLAEAGAFDSFSVSRRDAIWQVRGLAPHAEEPLDLELESNAHFPALARGEEVAWDYRSSHHSPRGHPMEQLRARLTAEGIPSADQLKDFTDGHRVTCVGVVICRQRPQTATGVTFMTLEDETGFINLVLWRDVFDRHSYLCKAASILGACGKLQMADGVIHLVAKTLFAPNVRLSDDAIPTSRNFH